jgi:hypothetical protein
VRGAGIFDMKKPPSESNGGTNSSVNGSGNHDEAASAGTVAPAR